MASRVLIDTNVLIYARDDRFPDKQRVAQAWMARLVADKRALVSPQVVGEFVNAMIKNKMVPANEIRASLDALQPFSRGATTETVIAQAWDLRGRTGFQWWDCVILASAIAQECDYLLSEDYQAGRTIDGVTIINPFTSDPGSDLPSSKAN